MRISKNGLVVIIIPVRSLVGVGERMEIGYRSRLIRRQVILVDPELVSQIEGTIVKVSAHNLDERPVRIRLRRIKPPASLCLDVFEIRNGIEPVPSPVLSAYGIVAHLLDN